MTLPGSIKLVLAKSSSFLCALKTQHVSVGADGDCGSNGGNQPEKMNFDAEKSRDKRWDEINRNS